MSPTARPLRVAVVGAGEMGRNHLRVYSALKGVEVVAVVDPDAERAERAAAQYGCRALASVEGLVGLVEAASVAVPSSSHADVGAFLLDHGVHCLIEKPLATTRDECRLLIDTAARRGVVLLVGHVERFNPVVQQLAEILEGATVHAVDARRMSAVSKRIVDVDVVADLMVHDLDIVLSLTKSPVTEVFAQGVRTNGASGEDYVTAALSFADGAMASLTASRITQNKIRELHVTADLGFVTANYTTQELLVYRQGQFSRLTTPGGQAPYALDLAIERVFVRAGEPLVRELQHFVGAVVEGEPVRVPGEDALEALELVWRVQDLVSGAVLRG